MPQARQKRSQEKRFLSPAFSAFLQNRLKEIIGVILLSCGFLLFLALFSYNPADSAANISSYGKSKNIMGALGAYFADGFLQWFGLASYFIVISFFVYGIHFMRNMAFKGALRLRPFLILPTILGFSALCAWLTGAGPHSEPFVNKGYGGAMGDILARLFSGQTSLFAGIIPMVIFLVVAVITVILATYALILPFIFWQRQWSYVQKAVLFLIRPHDGKTYEDDEYEDEEEVMVSKPSIVVHSSFEEEAPQFEAPRFKEVEPKTPKTPLWKKWQSQSSSSPKVATAEDNLFDNPIDNPPQPKPMQDASSSAPSSPKIYAAAFQDNPYEKAEDTQEITPASQVEDDFDDEDMDDDFMSELAKAQAQPSQRPQPQPKAQLQPMAQPQPQPKAAAPSAVPKPAVEKVAPSAYLDDGQDNMVIKANPSYKYPTLQMLDKAPPKADQDPAQIKKLEENAKRLEQTLQEFGVKGQIVSVRPGPVVTLYELEPAPGTRTSRVVGLSDDIARQMLVASVRVAPVAGKNVIGIEMPNEKRETVWLRTLFEHESFRHAKGKLAMALGENIGGEPMVVDLAKMPHLLIAGTTGSGKSVAVNTMILSLLYRLKPEECRLIMIDPKMLELSVYEDIPHLLTPVVTDPMKAVVSLKWAVREMDDRYRKMAKMGVRNIAGYNSRIKEALANGETLSKDVQTGFDENGHPITESVPLDMNPMPYIVILIDEVADLMMMGGKQDIEIAVQRLAQKARAAGIHVIMATQRPSVDVITGTIKANFPTRISFAVTSRIDSRTILGEQGAEQLLGMGDMLYMAGGGKTERAHGPFVSDEEVEEIANHIRKQGRPQYVSAVLEDVSEDGSPATAAGGGDSGEKDVLYDQALAVILKEKKASTSFIQRQLAIGYNRAARIIDQLEADGIISPADRVGRRTVLAEDHSYGDAYGDDE